MLTSRSLYNRGLQTCEKAGSTKPPLSQTIRQNIFVHEKRMAIPNAILFWRRYFCYLLGVAKTI